ncbi:MAG: peptidase domain-containing ABC transporter, partial [Saprospiraceae bacterium]
GGGTTFDRIRELSGTSKRGTTMLGLIQAAQGIGLAAEGFSAEIIHLQECKDLCILHIIKDEQMYHYVLCYGWDEGKQAFVISDPAELTPTYLTKDALEKIWQSRSLVLLKPTDAFVQHKETHQQKWQWIKDALRQDINILSTALVLGLITAVLGLATAIFSQKLIDDILPAKDALRLFSGVALLTFLLLMRSGLSYIRSTFLIRQSRDFNTRIIDYFYSSILHLPKSFFDNRKTGDLIARMTDTQRIQHTVSMLFSTAMVHILLVVVSVATIFVYSAKIGGISLLWIPVYGWIVYIFHHQIIAGQQMVMGSYARSKSNFIDTIQGVDDIKIRNKQSLFVSVNKTIYGMFQKAIYDLSKIGLRYNITTEIASVVFTVGVLTWSAIDVIDGGLTIGGFMVILQMIGMLMSSASQLAATNIQIQEAKVAFDRMYEFTSIPEESASDQENSHAQITDFAEIKGIGLSFRFPGRPLIINDINFSVKTGEWISVIGESGSGKSTLMSILQKFYHPESGSIKVNGIDLDLIATPSWRAKLGVVSQDIKIFNGTLLDNILLGEPLTDPAAIEIFFTDYGFDQYFANFPAGYATLLGEDGINISGGQQQLVALARALYHRPQLILLDEPTAALDRNTEHFVLELLQRLKKDTAIITLTHHILTARRSDRIYILDQGSFHISGTHDELLTHQDNLYAKAWSDYAV